MVSTALGVSPYASPAVWFSSPRTVTGDTGSSSTGERADPPANTFTRSNAGMYFDTGSSSPTLPSSTSRRIPAATTGFVMEYTWKIVLGRSGARSSTSAQPNARS